MENSEKDVMLEIWLKISRRIRDRLKKRIVRNKEGQLESEAAVADGETMEVLEAIDCGLADLPEAQVIFRELYVPILDGSSSRSPSLASIQNFLGTSAVWARENSRSNRRYYSSCL